MNVESSESAVFAITVTSVYSSSALQEVRNNSNQLQYKLRAKSKDALMCHFLFIDIVLNEVNDS